MALALIPGDTFTFSGINSLAAFGIKVIAYDVFSPAKRDRRVTIPFRHGSYQYGEKWHEDRFIRLDCCTEGRQLTKADMRAVAGWLSARGPLILWDEPEKHYMAELLDAPDIRVLPKYAKQQFTLNMRCDPFAIRGPFSLLLASGLNSVSYSGTVSAPTLITLKNVSDVPIHHIQITAVQQA